MTVIPCTDAGAKRVEMACGLGGRILRNVKNAVWKWAALCLTAAVLSGCAGEDGNKTEMSSDGAATGLRLWELGGRAADRGTPRLWLVMVQARELWEITAVQVMVPQVQTPRL